MKRRSEIENDSSASRSRFRSERSLRHSFDDCGWIAGAIRRQGVEIGGRVGEQSGGDGHRDVSGQPMCSQHRVHQRPAGPAIAIGEGMDGFELSMGDGGVCQGRHIQSANEANQVSHQ